MRAPTSVLVFSLAAVLAAWPCSAAAQPAATASGVLIVHGSPAGYPFLDKPAYPPGEYLALRCDQACRLEKTTVVLEQALVDDSEGGKLPGYRLKVRDKTPSLFLVRGLAGLGEGEVATWYVNRRFLGTPATVSAAALRAPQRRVVATPLGELRIEGELEAVPDELCSAADCARFPQVSWRMRMGDTLRTLAVVRGTEFGAPLPVEDFLVWAGDLDGDGRPDLVVRPQDRPDYLELALFLSTDLRPGQPWRRAASFYFWDPDNPGC